MKIKSATITLCKRALYESVSTKDMCLFAKLLDNSYNIYDRSGFPANVPISNQNAANQIVNDVIQDERFIDFIEVLLKVSTVGYMGRIYAINHLPLIIRNLQKEGFCFDETTGQIFEDQIQRATPNWGRLLDGDERTAALLRLDIVDNSGLVKSEDSKKIKKAYKDLRNIFERAVLSRSGRLWAWEGDGALAAFVFGEKEKEVLMAGMEVLNELFFYNRFENPLQEAIKVRIAANAGTIKYNSDLSQLLKNQLVKETMDLEKYATSIDSFSVSPNLFISIDDVVQKLFTEKTCKKFGKVRKYCIGMEKS